VYAGERKATHGLDGQHQDVDRTPSGRVNQRTGINGESTYMVWPTLGSRMAKKQNRTELLHNIPQLVDLSIIKTLPLITVSYLTS